MAKPHPVKGIIALSPDTNVRLAALYGCSAHFFGRVINDYEPPPRRFRAFLSAYFGMPEAELFHNADELVGNPR